MPFELIGFLFAPHQKADIGVFQDVIFGLEHVIVHNDDFPIFSQEFCTNIADVRDPVFGTGPKLVAVFIEENVFDRFRQQH